MKTIYLTHCSRDKDDALMNSAQTVTPDRLYTFPPLQDFIIHCRKNQASWAIFSDNYGVVFPEDKIAWYSKPPAAVTEEEFQVLLENFVTRLSGYDRIVFHLRAEDAHPLFERIFALARERGLPVERFAGTV